MVINGVINHAQGRPFFDGWQGAAATGAIAGLTAGVAAGPEAVAAFFGRTTLAATGGAAAGAAPAAAKIAIEFGRNENQVEHAFRHTDKLGLARDAVTAAIQQHLPTVASQIEPGKPLNSVIEVGGQRIQYTAFQVAEGVINVGRIHGAP